MRDGKPGSKLLFGPVLVGSLAAWSVTPALGAESGGTLVQAAERAVSPWQERRFALDAHLGLGTPYGVVGGSFDFAVLPALSLCLGAGHNLAGLQLASNARFRFTPEREASLYVGGGYSRGGFEQSYLNYLGLASVPKIIDVLASGTSPPARIWNVAHWLNLELGADARPHGALDLRGYLGVSILLNAKHNSVEAPDPNEKRRDPLDVVPIVLYSGVAVGLAL